MLRCNPTQTAQQSIKLQCQTVLDTQNTQIIQVKLCGENQYSMRHYWSFALEPL